MLLNVAKHRLSKTKLNTPPSPPNQHTPDLLTLRPASALVHNVLVHKPPNHVHNENQILHTLFHNINHAVTMSAPASTLPPLVMQLIVDRELIKVRSIVNDTLMVKVGLDYGAYDGSGGACIDGCM